MGLEELCGAPVEADGLALGQLALAVRLVDALEGADLDHADKDKQVRILLFSKKKRRKFPPLVMVLEEEVSFELGMLTESASRRRP